MVVASVTIFKLSFSLKTQSSTEEECVLVSLFVILVPRPRRRRKVAWYLLGIRMSIMCLTLSMRLRVSK